MKGRNPSTGSWQPMGAGVGRKGGDAGGVMNDRISDGPQVSSL